MNFYSNFDFNESIQRRGTDSAKWHKYRDRDIIPLWVADMDFRSPPAVTEALIERVNHGIFGYGVVQDQLREAVTGYLQRSFGWQIDARWIVWLPGVVTGLNLACRSIRKQGQAIVTTTPVYPPFLSAHRNSGHRLRTSAMIESSHGWQIDLDALERQIDDDTALYMLCNPQNPTGRVFGRNELMRISRICLKHGTVICSDEIHCDLVLDQGCRHIPIATLDEEIAQHSITLMAPSKTYNIPGLGCSYAIIPNDGIRRRFKQAMAGIVPYVNVMGMTATHAAYDNGTAWLEAALEYLRSNQQLVIDTVQDMDGLKAYPSQATYLAWIDARDLDTENPARFFEHAGVGLSDGRDFGAPGFVRLNFGCPRSLLTQGLERMAAATAAGCT